MQEASSICTRKHILSSHYYESENGIKFIVVTIELTVLGGKQYMGITDD